jgi:hypothetical protein
MRTLKFIGFLLLTTNLFGHVDLETKLTDSIFSPGDEIKLEWLVVIEHDPIDWDLYYSIDGGETWEVIEEGIRLERLDYVWKAPDVESSRMMVQIVQDNDIMPDYSDYSDTFTITSEQLTPVYDLPTSSFRLSTFPTPTNGRLNIDLVLKEHQMIHLDIMNTSGQKVDEILTGEKFQQGEYKLYRDLSQLKPGLYFLRIEIDGLSFSRPILYLP